MRYGVYVTPTKEYERYLSNRDRRIAHKHANKCKRKPRKSER